MTPCCTPGAGINRTCTLRPHAQSARYRGSHVGTETETTRVALRVINLLAFVGTVVVNALATTLPIGG